MGALCAVGASVCWAAVALIFRGLRCEEDCSPRHYSSRWQDDPAAWEWSAEVILAFGGVACACAALYFAIRGRGTRAMCALAGLGLLGVLWSALIALT